MPLPIHRCRHLRKLAHFVFKDQEDDMSTMLIGGPVGNGDPKRDDCAGGTQSQHDAAPKPPDPNRNRHRRSGQGRREPPPQELHIPSRRAILATLTKLPQLVATGVLTPAQANSMRATLEILLNELRQDSHQTSGAKDGNVSQLRDVLRRNPELLNALAPLLSDHDLSQLIDDDDTNDDDGDGAGAADGNTAGVSTP